MRQLFEFSTISKFKKEQFPRKHFFFDLTSFQRLGQNFFFLNRSFLGRWEDTKISSRNFLTFTSPERCRWRGQTIIICHPPGSLNLTTALTQKYYLSKEGRADTSQKLFLEALNNYSEHAWINKGLIKSKLLTCYIKGTYIPTSTNNQENKLSVIFFRANYEFNNRSCLLQVCRRNFYHNSGIIILSHLLL